MMMTIKRTSVEQLVHNKDRIQNLLIQHNKLQTDHCVIQTRVWELELLKLTPTDSAGVIQLSPVACKLNSSAMICMGRSLHKLRWRTLLLYLFQQGLFPFLLRMLEEGTYIVDNGKATSQYKVYHLSFDLKLLTCLET